MKWVSGWIESNFEASIHWSCAVSLCALSLNSLTDSLTDCCLLDFIDVTLACEYTNSNLLRLLMLVLRNLLTKVWCRCGSWSLVIKLNFCSDFEHKVCSRFWRWSSGEIVKLMFGQYFTADAWLRLWSLVETLKLVGLVKILKFKW